LSNNARESRKQNILTRKRCGNHKAIREKEKNNPQDYGRGTGRHATASALPSCNASRSKEPNEPYRAVGSSSEILKARSRSFEEK
jgi:hypothetical protein